MNEKWRDVLSKPKYSLKLEKDVRVSMRDGVPIATDIYRPDAEGQFPALLSISPYGKGLQTLPVPDFPSDSRLGNGGIEAGNSEYFVSRGYIHVIADCRGTGYSGGAYRVLTKKEYEDGHDLVEWVATQPWCNGNVGFLGMSYFSMIQFGIAAENPPHLKALFAFDALTDMYRHWGYHGGILNLGFFLHWWPTVLAHTIESPDLPEAELRQLVEEIEKDGDIRSYPIAYIALLFPQKNIHLFDLLTHPLDGSYYWERSAYTKFEKIKIPCYMLSRWTAWGLHLPGAFSAYSGIDAPKKLMITIPESGSGFNRPWVKECHDLVLRWYDYWLKGINTGIMDEPPISILVQGVNRWREEDDWPLAGTKWTKFYLRGQGLLSPEPPGEGETPDVFTNKFGLKPGEKVPSITYTTPPLAEDIEVTGQSALYLRAALSTDDTNWMIELRDVAPDGASKTLTMGWLKASHWEIDETRSQEYQPFHPHTRRAPIETGKVYEYAIDIRETSVVFQRGHRIQILIKAQDAPWEGKEYFHAFLYHLPRSKETQHTIYHTPERLSYVILPVIPK